MGGIIRIHLRGLLIALSAVLLTGCVERTLRIGSEPEGAVVFLNDVEVGRTPLVVPFTWYGDYDVVLRMEKNIPATIDLYMMALPVVRWLPRQPTVNGQVGPPIRNPTPEQIKTASANALQAAKDIVAKLKAGGDFSQLAGEFGSREASGTYHYANTTKESMANQKLADYVFELPARTIGEPLLLEDPDPAKSYVFVVMIGERVEIRRYYLHTNKKAVAPWHQWVGVDFFSEILPVEVKDEQLWTFLVPEVKSIPDDDLLEHAKALKAEMEKPSGLPAAR